MKTESFCTELHDHLADRVCLIFRCYIVGLLKIEPIKGCDSKTLGHSIKLDLSHIV